MNLHWMKYMVLTGLPLSAEEARLAGLVNTVVPAGEHLAEAERLAETIASRSPLALSVGKGILNRGAWETQQYVGGVDRAAAGRRRLRGGHRRLRRAPGRRPSRSHERPGRACWPRT